MRAGKIRYFGFSDMPAWFATRAATLAQAHGVPGPIAMQLEYSLVARRIEGEHLPAAQALGVVPWSPLAGGFLAGKYARSATGASGEGRLTGPNPFGSSKFSDHNWAVLDTLRTVAAQLDRPLEQVALAWVAAHPASARCCWGPAVPSSCKATWRRSTCGRVRSNCAPSTTPASWTPCTTGCGRC